MKPITRFGVRRSVAWWLHRISPRFFAEPPALEGWKEYGRWTPKPAPRWLPQSLRVRISPPQRRYRLIREYTIEPRPQLPEQMFVRLDTFVEVEHF